MVAQDTYSHRSQSRRFTLESCSQPHLHTRLRLLSVVAPLLALCSCEWFVLLSRVLLSRACARDLAARLRQPEPRMRLAVRGVPKG